MAPTPPLPAPCLATCRTQTVVRNRAAIIRKAELTGDAGSLVSVSRRRRITERREGEGRGGEGTERGDGVEGEGER